VANILHRLHVPYEAAYKVAAGVQQAVDRFLSLIGLEASTRDLALLHDLLYRKGWAAPLGSPFAKPVDPPADDTAIAAARLMALLTPDAATRIGEDG
jgi:hypothetical protein